MIRIDVYAVLGATVVSVSHLKVDADHPEAAPQKDNLTYQTFMAEIAHDETEVVARIVKEALKQAERAASERGGWSVLT